MKKMLIRDFIKQEIDIDVCDDYDESCYIAFVGPLELTPEGEAEFADVLDRDIFVPTETERHYNLTAVLPAKDDREVCALAHFFFSAAGYCSVKNDELWFGKTD